MYKSRLPPAFSDKLQRAVKRQMLFFIWAYPIMMLSVPKTGRPMPPRCSISKPARPPQVNYSGTYDPMPGTSFNNNADTGSNFREMGAWPILSFCLFFLYWLLEAPLMVRTLALPLCRCGALIQRLCATGLLPLLLLHLARRQT